MKKILTLLVIALTACAAKAEMLTFLTTAYYTSTHYSKGWSNWSSPQASNMGVVFDLDKDAVFIDSPSPQYYQILSVVSKGYNAQGEYERKFKFVDQDGDHGTMRLVKRNDGKNQIYITFNNIRWCYDVIPIN